MRRSSRRDKVVYGNPRGPSPKAIAEALARHCERELRNLDGFRKVGEVQSGTWAKNRGIEVVPEDKAYQFNIVAKSTWLPNGTAVARVAVTPNLAVILYHDGDFPKEMLRCIESAAKAMA